MVGHFNNNIDMKYIIQESRLKNLVVDKIGLDLTNKISIITHPNELPIHWDNNFFSPQQMNRILNNRGPLYLVEYGKKEYLVIPRDAEKEGKGWWVLDQYGDLFHEYKFMQILGVDIIGLGFDQLLNIFFDENETIKESNYKTRRVIITESKIKKYVNDYLDDRFLNTALHTGSFIIVSDIYDVEEEPSLEYDYEDGRLYINEMFLENINSIFPVGFEKSTELIKDWFESKYDVTVKYIS